MSRQQLSSRVLVILLKSLLSINLMVRFVEFFRECAIYIVVNKHPTAILNTVISCGHLS